MLAIDGLVAGHGGSPLARLPRLTLAGGQAGLLLGPSGSGKTTLLLAIAGLADIVEGSVRIDGQDISALKTSARDRFRGSTIGLVFQDLHLVSGLSTLDNVLLAPFAIGAAQHRARALDLLDGLGLADRVHSKAETLSRGEAQRAAIARAMLLRPKVILADEPTASLDDESCSKVADLLAHAAEQSGAALVIATHDARLRRRFEIVVQAEPIKTARGQ
ncbi:MAG TPA: ATP-binding cassette domain-containing protein [Magnetospirillaceae bacterium]|nr:ATP-binding cassette domain-containing protein [Magnetospirillaceae bacterium]